MRHYLYSQGQLFSSRKIPKNRASLHLHFLCRVRPRYCRYGTDQRTPRPETVKITAARKSRLRNYGEKAEEQNGRNRPETGTYRAYSHTGQGLAHCSRGSTSAWRLVPHAAVVPGTGRQRPATRDMGVSEAYLVCSEGGIFSGTGYSRTAFFG